MAATGRCQCGQVSYSVTGEPGHRALCHCADCRRSAGAYVIGWALFRRDQVTIAGEPVSYASSEGTIRQFCGTCGTGLFYLNDTIFPGKIDIQSATFDDPDAIPPMARIQLAEAPRWYGDMMSLPGFARFPAG